MNNFEKIQDLLRLKAELSSKLKHLSYSGTVEIKESKGNKYLYLRNRVNGKLNSKYIDTYTDDLYLLLLKVTKEAKEIKKNIKKIEKELIQLDYFQSDLPKEVLLNLDFARANLKNLIYDQAILEGIATTFPDTETIIERGKINNMNVEDVLKILNLKHSWDFILDQDVISSNSHYHILCHIAKLINEGLYQNGDKIRNVPVRIGGTTYVPDIPLEAIVIEEINELLSSGEEDIYIAIKLCLYCMKKQIFIDGNKRASIIFANHFLISKGMGIIVVPFDKVPDFKKLLVLYYEDKENSFNNISKFMIDYCWSKFE